TNGVEDAYEYDALTGQVHLLSSGTGEYPSWFLDASADGSDAFIITAQPLLGWDHDQAYDLYDVRIGGGFPEPPAQTGPCSSAETCAQALGPVPLPSAYGSGSPLRPNPKPPRSCSKDRLPKRVHDKNVCLKPRRHHKHHHAHRRAPGRRGAIR